MFGSFSLTFNFNGVEKTQNVEVVEYVNTFMTGISYSEYLETIGNLNNQSISANFLNKTAQKYQVGVDNSYHFDFIIWRTIWTVLICLLIGTNIVPPEHTGFIENLTEVIRSGVCYWRGE